MKLIIAEKPSLARSVAKVIGIIKEHKDNGYIECKDGYNITWVFGHILELATPDAYDEKYKRWNMDNLPIRPTNWIYEPKKDAVKQFNNIKKLITSATTIINCGDPDREGQLLVDELLLHVNCKKPTKRLMILDPKDAAIRKAIDSMEDNSKYYSWYQAGLLRSQADWLIGMNFSPAFSLLTSALTGKFGAEAKVSTGRVQTPTLKLIYDRDLAITNFKPLNYYNLFVTFNNKDNKPFSAKLDFTSLNLELDEQNRLLSDKTLINIMSEVTAKSGTITKYETKDCETQPPLTFKLSDLQAVANAKLGYSADDTLVIAQTLYEKQLTTYPRSACEYLPDSLHADATDILSGLTKVFTNGEILKANPALKSRVFDDKKLGGESHFAIIPTGDMANLGSLNAKELALYKLIALQYLAQFYPNMKYEQTTGVVQVQNKYNFNFSGRVTKSLGWKELFTSQADKDVEDSDKADDEDNQTLPPLSLNEVVTQKSSEIKKTTTKKPKPYTEGLLIKAMANIHNELENIVKSYYSDPAQVKDMVAKYKGVLKDTAGLGTEATRSGIIKTLKTRGFIELKGKNLQITEKAKSFMQLLTTGDNLLNFSMLTSPLTTAMYEQQLDGVLNHTFTAEQFNKNLDTLLNDKLAIIKNIISTTTPVQSTKAPTKSTGEKCPECQHDLIEREGKFGKFISCSNYPKCKYSPPKPEKANKPAAIPTGELCPKCGCAMVTKTAKASGKTFLACSGYPKCNHVQWN